MEGSYVEEFVDISRDRADRALRAYRKMSSVMLSSRDYGRRFGEDDTADEAALRAQMYSLRSLVLSIEDARERMLLYHYYIKGSTLPICAKLLGVSLRTVSRIKNSALDNFALKMKLKDDE